MGMLAQWPVLLMMQTALANPGEEPVCEVPPCAEAVEETPPAEPPAIVATQIPPDEAPRLSPLCMTSGALLTAGLTARLLLRPRRVSEPTPSQRQFSCSYALRDLIIGIGELGELGEAHDISREKIRAFAAEQKFQLPTDSNMVKSVVANYQRAPISQRILKYYQLEYKHLGLAEKLSVILMLSTGFDRLQKIGTRLSERERDYWSRLFCFLGENLVVDEARFHEEGIDVRPLMDLARQVQKGQVDSFAVMQRLAEPRQRVAMLHALMFILENPPEDTDFLGMGRVWSALQDDFKDAERYRKYAYDIEAASDMGYGDRVDPEVAEMVNLGTLLENPPPQAETSLQRFVRAWWTRREVYFRERVESLRAEWIYRRMIQRQAR